MGGNEHHSSDMQIAFLVPHMSVNGSFLDQHNFILLKVFVRWYCSSWRHVFRQQHQVLRAIALRGDLEDESSRVNLAGFGTPQTPLAVIFLQQERLWVSLRSGCRASLS
jgi:hypothetical protein